MRLLERIPHDLAELFRGIEEKENSVSVGNLWDEDETVVGGINYGTEA